MKFVCPAYPCLTIGKKITFTNGVYETSDKNEAASIFAFADQYGITCEDIPAKAKPGPKPGAKRGPKPKGEVQTQDVETTTLAPQDDAKEAGDDAPSDLEAIADKLAG